MGKANDGSTHGAQRRRPPRRELRLINFMDWPETHSSLCAVRHSLKSDRSEIEFRSKLMSITFHVVNSFMIISNEIDNDPGERHNGN